MWRFFSSFFSYSILDFIKVLVNFKGLYLISNRARWWLPWWLSSKESACNAVAAGDTGLIPGAGKSPWGGCGNPLQYPYLESPMGRGAWWATVHRVSKSWTQLEWPRTGLGIGLSRWGSVVKNLPAKQETWVLSLGLEDALEEEVATHSNILTWRIPWTEEPGRLQSMGL